MPHISKMLGFLAFLSLATATLAGSAQAETTEGEWVSRPSKNLDTTLTHRLQLRMDGSKVKGDLVVESAMPVPLSSWIDRFCDGNERLEQVVRYRVTGERNARALALRYSGPKVEKCSCPAKCVVKDKSGTIDAYVNPDTGQIVWDDKVLYGVANPGTAEVPVVQPALPRADVNVSGSWSTTAERAMDRTITRLLDLEEKNGVLTGTYAEKTSRPFPLSNWRDRFCDGADAWNMVEIYELSGTRSRDLVKVEAKKGRIAACSCPQKCRANTRGTAFELRVTADGRQLRGDIGIFTRTEVPAPVGEPAAAPTGSPTPHPRVNDLEGYPAANPEADRQ